MLSAAWPAYGDIPAGPLSDLLGDEEAVIAHVDDLLPMIRTKDFFLTVDGDSMIEGGLDPGMTLLMRPVQEIGPDIEPGEICAVWIDGDGGTLKQVYFESETVRLVPANQEYEEQTYPAERVHVQGALVAAIKIDRFR